MFSFCDLADACPSPLGLHRTAAVFDLEDYSTKRTSHFSNTRHKEKEDLKNIIDLSVEKLSSDCCLRTFVLIKNTIKRLHAELKRENRRASCMKKPARSIRSVTVENTYVGFNNCLSIGIW